MVMNFYMLGQNPESELAKARRLGNEEILIAVLDSITHSSSTVFRDFTELTDLLSETMSPKVRAAVAMTLADIHVRDAAPSIISVISRPDVIHSSGTLLYALSELGASLPLDLIVSIVERGSFEARAEALTFMEEDRVATFDEADWREATERLDRLQHIGDNERAEAASLALEYLTELIGRKNQ